MPRSKGALIFIAALSVTIASQSADSQARTSLPCSKATMARPGVGVGYKGEVSIDDFALHAHIPDELTGWGGVASNAPFHGFTIFLDPAMHSCIIFEMQLRIDEDEAPKRPKTSKTLLLGDATAWQVSSSNRAKGLTNIQTYFSFSHDGHTDDGKVLLITRPGDLQKAKPIYDTFLKSVALGVPHSR
jgi:hypothetical protein